MVGRKEMFDRLALSGLDEEDAKKLRIKFLNPTETKKLTDHELPSFQIPYFQGGRINGFWRIRLLERPKRGFNGDLPPKYLQPKNSTPHIYLPPLLSKQAWTKIFGDAGTPLVITEGELKAASACKNRVPTIGLGGVWSWCNRRERQEHIPDLDPITWNGRKVCLAFDSDLREKPEVRLALTSFAEELLSLGAHPHIAYVPDVLEDGKTGLDDYIVAEGRDALAELIDGAEEYVVSRELHKLNNHVAVVRSLGSIIDLSTRTLMTAARFKEVDYADWKVRVETADGGTRLVSAPTKWLQWPGRNTVESLTYEPGHPRILSDGSINLWRGWGVKPKRGSVEPWRRLLDYFFPGQPQARTWFERWCAYPLQYPGTKLYTSVLLWSFHHGTGKSLTGETLGRIYGDNFIKISSDQLHANFNGWSVNKQFILGDEIVGLNRRRDADRIRDLITQPTIYVNMKYVPEYTVPDHANYLLTSNHPDALYLETNDRRAFVHEVQDPPLLTEFYEIYRAWKNEDGPAHLFYHLLHLDLGDFNPRTAALVTEAKRHMIENIKSKLDSWVTDLAYGLEELYRMQPDKTGLQLWDAQDLLQLYDPTDAEHLSVTSMSRALKRAGFAQLPRLRVGGRLIRPFVLDNPGRWRRSTANQQRNHIESFKKSRKY